jgi:hypothetical protein
VRFSCPTSRLLHPSNRLSDIETHMNNAPCNRPLKATAGRGVFPQFLLFWGSFWWFFHFIRLKTKGWVGPHINSGLLLTMYVTLWLHDLSCCRSGSKELGHEYTCSQGIKRSFYHIYLTWSMIEFVGNSWHSHLTVGWSTMLASQLSSFLLNHKRFMSSICLSALGNKSNSFRARYKTLSS